MGKYRGKRQIVPSLEAQFFKNRMLHLYKSNTSNEKIKLKEELELENERKNDYKNIRDLK